MPCHFIVLRLNRVLLLLAVAAIAGGVAAVAAEEPSPPSADASPRTEVGRGIVSSPELAKVLDLRQLPAAKGTKFHKRTAAEISAEVPAKPPEILKLYLKAFADLGFRPTKGSPIVADDFALAELARDRFVASVTILKDTKADTMTVMVVRQGAFDCSKLPVTEGGKALGATLSSAMFIARAGVAEESEPVINALVKSGWQKFEVPTKVLADTTDMRTFNLRNQGYRVLVTVSKPPVPNSKTMVQYQMSTIAHELPAPPEARDIVFDDANRKLKCHVPGDVVDVAKFYRDAMPKVGYKALQDDDPKPDRILLRFEPPEKGILLVDLTTEDHKTTTVELTWQSPESSVESDPSKK